jgi:hypothetical protein
MNERVTKKEILVFAGIIVAMLGSLVYGFFVVGAGQMPENCWDKYTTEQEAILNCEGENE